MNMEKAVTWERIETILLKDYPVGKSNEGNSAYSPLFFV